ncbi:hypothetical protein CTAYLR_009195 [Chrysophaeum taylorii]|uniref:Superoxide dismutase copper/zinc binding domain-containing protein n=1 Tax=Chrysophaeum taylorii TaxID=2483200 RepID=A0AAD7ULJ1_9STRA|nr:hypothetical protein CTAYLR_009195 [Chrysophaeum taylorii]
MVAWAFAMVVGDGIRGNVSFYEGSPLEVRVVARIAGFGTDGLRGFHVHEFGDMRSGFSAAAVGNHFVAPCQPINGSFFFEEKCLDSLVHGYPPSRKRMNGELGNITIEGGVATYDYVVGQDKMSLSGGIESVVGRSIVVHEFRDDGSQPWGNSGGVAAAGVIFRDDAPDNRASGAAGESAAAVVEGNVLRGIALATPERVSLKLSGVEEEGEYTLEVNGTALLSLTAGGETGKTAAADAPPFDGPVAGRYAVVRRWDGEVVASGPFGIANDNLEAPSIGAAVAMFRDGEFSLIEYDGDPLTVKVSGAASVPGADGQRGFHVHVYGDIREPLSYARLGLHAIISCSLNLNATCEEESHAYPPSPRRLSGDLGNATVLEGVATYDYVLRQNKVSVSDALRSVVGRSLVVHELADDGLPPFGNSGGAVAAAVIEVADPRYYGVSENHATAATTFDEADFLVAVLEGPSGGGVAAATKSRLAVLCDKNVTLVEVRAWRSARDTIDGPVLASWPVSSSSPVDFDYEDTLDAAGRILVVVDADGAPVLYGPFGFALSSAVDEIFRQTGRLDCEWSDWSDWSSCRGECGFDGSRNRSRTRAPARGFEGDCWDIAYETQRCYHACEETTTTTSSSSKSTSSDALAVAAAISVVVALILIFAAATKSLHDRMRRVSADAFRYHDVAEDDDGGLELAKNNNKKIPPNNHHKFAVVAKPAPQGEDEEETAPL